MANVWKRGHFQPAPGAGSGTTQANKSIEVKTMLKGLLSWPSKAVS